MAKVPLITFSDGNSIPVLGLGTNQNAPGEESEVTRTIELAIDLGYRMFDCAHSYGNEEYIGEGIQSKIEEGVVKREDLFITSKLWSTFHSPELVEESLRQTLKDLQLDYVNLYLIHFPMGFKEGEGFFPVDSNGNMIPSDVDYVDTWKAMEVVHEKGLAKSIGVSNFNSQQIERLLKTATVAPVANQVELHPYLNQKKLQEFCEERNIKLTSYCPLGSKNALAKPGEQPFVIDDPKIQEIAKKYGKTPGQILVKWNVQSGNIVIPKSSNKQRMLDNLNIFDFELSAEDMGYIDGLNRSDGRICRFESASTHKYYPFNADLDV